MSLKNLLEQKLEKTKRLTRQQLRQIGREWGYDEANTDRQLRKLTEEQKVIPLKNDKGHHYITHYVWREKDTLF